MRTCLVEKAIQAEGAQAVWERLARLEQEQRERVERRAREQEWLERALGA